MIQYRKYQKDNRIGRIASGRISRITAQQATHRICSFWISLFERLLMHSFKNHSPQLSKKQLAYGNYLKSRLCTIFAPPLRERSKLQRNEFRRKGCFYPFREIHLAVGSLSPKGGAKIVQSRVKHYWQNSEESGIH